MADEDTQNLKHQQFHDQMLKPDYDLFTPEFKRDSKGRYFMQLPGYGKWMVSNEPGSKIIAQGSQDESGKAATDPASIRTGRLSVETTIQVGDSIFLNGTDGCIHIGDPLHQKGASIGICPNAFKGYSGTDVVFAMYLEPSGDFHAGDVFIGDYDSEEYLYWDDANGDLKLKGDLVIQGDIMSSNYVTGVSGYKLTYLTGSAEFQDVWVRGQVNMEAGSTGDASYIAETISRRWAAETGANITENHTSNNTSNVSFSTALDAATGAQRGLNAINAFYRYGTWLNSDEMTTMGGEPADTNTCVRMDSGGIYGWRTLADTPIGESRRTFWLDATTGDLMLRGTIYASAGAIAGWIIDADRLYKTKIDSGHYNKIELNSRSGAGVAPHFQVFSDTDVNFATPTGVQLTCDTGATPVPRMDVYDNGAKRAMINKDGMHLFDTSNNRRVLLNYNGIYWYNAAGGIVNQILASTADGDVTFGGGVVRCFANGVRVSYQQPFSAADGAGSYFQMYCDNSVYGRAGILSAPGNYIKVENVGHGAIAWFNGIPGGEWCLSLFGNLATYTNTYDQGSTTGALYFNTSSNKLRVRGTGGWMDVGASGLPGGGAYQTLRFDLTTLEWVNTSNLYFGSSGSYYIAKVGVDAWFNVPAGADYSFVRGGTSYAVIDENIWTRGHLYANGQLSVGGTIQNSAGDIIANAGNFISRNTNGVVQIRIGGSAKNFVPVMGAFNAAKYYLREA